MHLSWHTLTSNPQKRIDVASGNCVKVPQQRHVSCRLFDGEGRSHLRLSCFQKSLPRRKKKHRGMGGGGMHGFLPMPLDVLHSFMSFAERWVQPYKKEKWDTLPSTSYRRLKQHGIFATLLNPFISPMEREKGREKGELAILWFSWYLAYSIKLLVGKGASSQIPVTSHYALYCQHHCLKWWSRHDGYFVHLSNYFGHQHSRLIIDKRR